MTDASWPLEASIRQAPSKESRARGLVTLLYRGVPWLAPLKNESPRTLTCPGNGRDTVEDNQARENARAEESSELTS